MFEIRNYHYAPEKIDAYKKWAVEHAIPFLQSHLDIVGFWIDNIAPAEISGHKPMLLEHGSANVTWIIRWDSMAARNKFRNEVLKAQQWQKIWNKHPDITGYLQIESRFTELYSNRY